MKTFYEMLKLLENEVTKVSVDSLTPEELEDYERERGEIAKALFLQDIAKKRKAEFENSPERIAAKAAKEKERLEAEKRQQKREKEQKELELQVDPDYTKKAFGILANAIEKSEGICKFALLGVEPNLKKDGNKWTYKNGRFVLEDVPVFDGKLGVPVTDTDKYFLKWITEGLVIAMEDSKEYDECKTIIKIIFDALIKLGCKPYPKEGEVVNFDGRHHNTKDPVDLYEKVRVVEPGLLSSLNHLLIKAKVAKIHTSL